MDIAAEGLPPLDYRFELESDQRSENKLKLKTDELVLDFTFTFKCIARLPCLNVGKLQALRPRGGGEVLLYVTLTGTCGPIGYGFHGVLS